MNNPLVTIIIPVYNGEEYISRCMNSVIKQTYNNIEIIIINDGSTDSTLEICNQFAKKDDRIFIYNKKNAGVSSARNYGIDMSKGEYIIFVDSDDYVESDLVEKHIKNIAIEERIDISVCGFIDELYNGEEIHRSENKRNYVYDVNEFNADDFVPYVCWQIMFKKDILNSVTYFNEEIHIKEDMLFIYEILMSSKKVAILSDVLYHSVHRDNSLSHSAMLNENVDKYLSSLIAFERILVITQKNSNLHKMISLAILKDIVKLKNHVLSINMATVDRNKKIEETKKLAILHVNMHDYGFREKIIILLLQYMPKLYLKLAH